MMNPNTLQRPPIRNKKQSPPQTRNISDESFEEKSFSEDGSTEDSHDTESPVSTSGTAEMDDIPEHSFENQYIDHKIESKNRKNNNKYRTKFPDKQQEIFFIRVCYISIIILILSVGLYYVLSSQQSSQEVNKQSAAFVIETLKKSFGKQNDHSWKIIKSALKNVLENPQPKAPAVIMLLSSISTSEISQCLAERIADRLSENFTRINGKDYEKKESNNVKEHIDSLIKSRFSNDTLNVCVVKFINSIPPEAAMIFHSYCDDGNANFKKSVFIITVVNQEKNTELLGDGFVDKVANKWLKNAWKDLHEDQLYPLLTRLTPSSVAVTHDVLPDVCTK